MHNNHCHRVTAHLQSNIYIYIYIYIYISISHLLPRAGRVKISSSFVKVDITIYLLFSSYGNVEINTRRQNLNQRHINFGTGIFSTNHREYDDNVVTVKAVCPGVAHKQSGVRDRNKFSLDCNLYVLKFQLKNAA